MSNKVLEKVKIITITSIFANDRVSINGGGGAGRDITNKRIEPIIENITNDKVSTNEETTENKRIEQISEDVTNGEVPVNQEITIARNRRMDQIFKKMLTEQHVVHAFEKIRVDKEVIKKAICKLKRRTSSFPLHTRKGWKIEK